MVSRISVIRMLAPKCHNRSEMVLKRSLLQLMSPWNFRQSFFELRMVIRMKLATKTTRMYSMWMLQCSMKSQSAQLVFQIGKRSMAVRLALIQS